MKPIIVVGSGMAGITLIREVRKLDTQTPIILVTADDGGFYSKPMLSNAFAQNKLPSQLKTQSAAQLAEQLSVTVLHHTRLEQIDTANQCIHTSMGDFEYRDLVLATGANPIRLPIAGSGAQQIQSINTLDDYTRFRASLDRLSANKTSVRIAILGAGLIGCEFADDLNQAGYDVHVIDPSTRPLATLLPQSISEELQNQLQNKGVHLHLNCSTNNVDLNGSVFELMLSDNTLLEVDLVLSAVGLIPDTQLAKRCQPETLKTERGILIDACGRTSAAHVFAIGDCAQYTIDDHGNTAVLPYIAPLLTAARAIAKSLTTNAATPSPIVLGAMPVIVKTPSCPIAVLPPRAQDRSVGRWHEERLEDKTLVSRFLLDDGSMVGFALAPNHAKLRSELLMQVKLR